jgi:cyclic beta-1,2-glucan synthetase
MSAPSSNLPPSNLPPSGASSGSGASASGSPSFTSSFASAKALPHSEGPIRAELFSVERLEQHAETLAATQTVDTELKRGRPLVPRVLENGRVLLEAYQALAQAIQQEHSITPAAEWLVDNFFIVDEQLRDIREDLPPRFYRKLPKLNSGDMQGYPRVFAVAWDYIAHTDSQFDPEILRRFINAYQHVQPLTIGELWAISITLRIVLVENLRRLAEGIVRSRAARQEADTLADRLLGIKEDAPIESAGTAGSGIAAPRATTEEILRSLGDRSLEPAFAVELLQRLRDLNPNVRPVLLWLEERLAAQHITADDIVRAEHQQQAALNVTVRNIITSMRLMSAFNWRDFFESVSLVDDILANSTNFGEIDFATRDAYRHAIESLSRGSLHSEVEIAQRLVQHVRRARIEARDGAAAIHDSALHSGEALHGGESVLGAGTIPGSVPMHEDRRLDPGYYLISSGRADFERELGFRLSWGRRLVRSYMRTALPGYLGTIAATTAIVMALPLLNAKYAGVPVAGLVILGFLALIPASDLAISLINRAVTDWLEPRVLPRLELRNGVPSDLRSLVVIPTLLTSQHEIQELLSRIEIHYLANPEQNLHFALLSDWVDAPTEHLPADDALLGAAAEGIAELNNRYGPVAGGGERFLLLHRRRVWNESEGKWMGWERKRGKLHELNQLLRGAADTHFIGASGRVPEALPSIRYVITLDSDTRLPRVAARHLIGTIAHPLNRPEFSPEAGRIVEGYGIVQPRITATLPSEHPASFFERVFSGPSGIDAYSSAVSDVYQDLFREGSYTGKGIYDVDAFESAMHARVPENALLSHDLFEGIFARTALDTDIELFEEFPMHYETGAARAHRWARGDWQLLPWILGLGRDKAKSKQSSAIPGVGRWKLVDNLRRSLSAPAAFLLLVVGWLMRPASPWVWTRFILAIVAIPELLPFLVGLNPRLGGVSKRSQLRAMWHDFVLSAARIGLNITFLAYQAWLMSDAILRTLARLFITHKHLLEWVTAAQAKYAVDLKLSSMYRRMIASPIIALSVLIVLSFGRHHALVAALPFIILWAVAPAVAQAISIPAPLEKSEPLTESGVDSLRFAARRTWHFFDTFVGEADNALPPDNFQEDPRPVVAHRTSPTNIGLYLVAILSARDLGWIGLVDTVERLEASLATMRRLELFRGHFYNWYDTSNLQPLDPKYISSVDSGNLAGDLLALRNGCFELLHQSLGAPRMAAGTRDSIKLLKNSLREVGDTRRTHTVTRKQLSTAADALDLGLDMPLVNALAAASQMPVLRRRAHTMADIAHTYTQERGDMADAEVRVWADGARACIDSHWRDAEMLLPWLQLDAKETSSRGDGTLRAALSSASALLETIPTVGDAPAHFERTVRAINAERVRLATATVSNTEVVSDALLTKIESLTAALTRASAAAQTLIQRIEALARTAEDMFHAMDFSFLFDETRELFSIGFRVNDGALDLACYDLLASEARLCSFIAIAKGDVPSKHWFRLGRALTPVGKGSALVSWSGSMFEYLMPELLMHSPPGSLLSETEHLVVQRQIDYGAERGVPWGVSECAFNARDIQLRYQYSGFGVPGLGLKRGLSEDVVIAPYATALAAMVDANAATHNFARIEGAGGRGRYGFYESLDYTATRVPEGKDVAIIYAYFAHHQGMTLVSLTNVLTKGSMQHRFHAEPIVKATELLLQERTPRGVLVTRPRAEEVSAAAHVRELVPPVLRRFTSPHDSVPRTQLLSNGRYAVMLTTAGSGYSRWRDTAVTRWREDVTCDCWGSYFYLRDVHTDQVWSAGYQPVGEEPDSYEVSFYEDRAEFVRRDRALTTALDVVVSPEDDAEMRRVSVTNHGVRTREIQITSYAEVVLASQASDVAHPAFSNLFVETEFAAEEGALLATRRRESHTEKPIWAAHVVAVEPEAIGKVEYETDRAKFIGRGHTVRNPVSIIGGPALSGTVGPVLDPVFSQRRTVRVPPGATAHVVFTTIIASSREEALSLADKYRDARTFERTLTMAWTQAQVQLRHWSISPDEAHLFQRLANAVLYSDPSLRPSPEVLAQGALNINVLWSFGISGDRPIVLVLVDDSDDIEIVRQLVRAHEYWRMKQLPIDLVVLNDKFHSYAQDLQNSLDAMIQSTRLGIPAEADDSLGKIYALRSDLIAPNARATLQSFAKAILISRRGSLSEQIARTQRPDPSATPAAKPAIHHDENPDLSLADLASDLEFYNGLGGFAEEGREYVTVLSEGLRTPLPWINVIANPSFGFTASEAGSGYAWAIDSQENQITPWSNDPVSNPPGDVFYIRDEATGEFWTPTALPIRQEAAVYVARHGQGYTRYEHSSHGIAHELLQFVPVADPVKISKLVLVNKSARARRISVTAYAEYVLGRSRGASAPYIISELDSQTRALFARNMLGGDFEGRVAFADLCGRQTSWTCDRKEFLGRNGALAQPAALAKGVSLSGKAGAYLDPCSALRTTLELAPGARAEVVFFLGQAENKSEAQDLIKRYRTADFDALLGQVSRFWDATLGTIQVKTPEPSMNVLLNRWLLYQTLSARIWGRTGFYQASGAYGFRDQLQDVTAFLVAKRDIARDQILRAASRQFTEGDVQHWWHPPSGRGVRTRISDDLLWLPYVVSRFVDATGDMSVLDESVPFLEGDALTPDQSSSYFQPRVSDTRASVFEHCARALDRSLAVGSHGLPLMGTGDWNDGMNRVGEHGKGESIWLGWFLHLLLVEFAKIADFRGETKRAETWRIHVTALKAALERDGWDGEWYRRAYFDDGTPLGSATNDECRIDSIAQSWGVISGAADSGRALRAMAAVDRYLVNRPDSLVLLLDPPFNQGSLDPGYIRGYLPGIRENGGQYTHAATWNVMACAMLGDGDRAGELFRMLNPINHAITRASIRRYKVEPYVVAGDVYSKEPHVGRGGWTWYTGSAGWLYRVGIESILGFKLRGMTLEIDPCIPRNWPGFSVEFRYHSALYKIHVENPSNCTRGVALAKMDGRLIAGPANIPLTDDHAVHEILVVLG